METVGIARQDAATRGGTVDRLVEHLRLGILRGRYAPGQRLIEQDLTSELGVSRGPLREAFRRVAAEGLLEIVPNRGAMVRRLSHRETVELFQIRTALEGLAVRLAALTIDEGGNRARFEAAIRPIWSDEPRLGGVAYHEENRQFHSAVFDICGNESLADLSRQLHLQMIMLQLSGLMTPAMYHDSVLEHRAIARAILAGDPVAAEQALQAHIGRASGIAIAMPSSTFRDGEGARLGLASRRTG